MDEKETNEVASGLANPSGANIELPLHSKKSMKKSPFLVLALALLIGAGTVAYFATKERPAKTTAQTNSKNNESEVQKTTFLKTPKKLDDLKLLSGTYNNQVTGFDYYQVGSLQDNSQIIVAVATGDNIATQIGYFVHKSGTYIFTKDNLFSETTDKLQFSSSVRQSTATESALELEQEIKLPVTGFALSSTLFATWYWSPRFPVTMPGDSSEKLVGTYPSGKLYLTQVACGDELQGGSKFAITACNSELYIMYRNDFRLAYYSPAPSLKFVGNVPSFKLADGTVNKTEYFKPRFLSSPESNVIVATNNTDSRFQTIGATDDGVEIYVFKTPELFHDDKNLILYKDPAGRFNILVSAKLNNGFHP